MEKKMSKIVVVDANEKYCEVMKEGKENPDSFAESGHI